MKEKIVATRPLEYDTCIFKVFINNFALIIFENIVHIPEEMIFEIAAIANDPENPVTVVFNV